MLRIKPLTIVLLLIGLLLSPLSAVRSAEEEVAPVATTTLEEETAIEPVSCSPALEITVLFAFRDLASKSDAAALLTRWQAGVAEVWQNPTARYNFGDNTCDMVPTIRLLELGAGETCGYLQWKEHCVEVVDAALNRRGQIADLSLGAIGRGVAAYGEWTTSTTGREAAHLIGHLLGIPEGYVQEVKDGSGPLVRLPAEQEILPSTTVTETADVIELPGSPMALDFATRTSLFPLPAELTLAASASDIQCDNSCYCGNGQLDRDRAERCDPAYSLNSCALGESCNAQCNCEVQNPVCGDGVLNAGEQCDPAGKDICPASYSCTNDCTCNPTESVPSRVDRLQYVCGNGICEQAESCTTCYLDCRNVLSCQACGNGICESSESTLSCQKDCGS